MKRDYYETLGVARDVSAEDLKKAYRKLAHQFHPDKNPGNPEAEAKFKEASEAYAVLSDTEKRAQYDRFGHQAFGGGQGAGDPFAGFDPFSSFGDLFSEFFGGDIFGRNGRGGRGRRGADLRYDLEVDFGVAALGGEQTLKIPKHKACAACAGAGGERETCARCGGRGQIALQQGFFRMARTCDRCGGLGQSLKRACAECRGKGRLETLQSLSVRIPAGVDTGVRLRLQGEGEAGYDGGPPGDLFVVIHVRDHPLFERDGTDLHCEVPISIAQAALGCEVEVPNLEGKESVELSPGTQSGEQVRLRGRGLPRLGGGPRGDIVARIFVEVPTKLDARQRELLEEFARVTGDEVSPRRRGFLDKLRDLFE
ncbi:MAG: molecular chaperone DnaJ [Deltaproteobacteria bacterium]|nr:molecular chaperone DnaJ [Deltaproteobacteria bacterium]